MAQTLEQKEYLDRKECSIYLKTLGITLSPKTLENLGSNNNAGDGPPFIRVRWKRVYYLRAEVDKWAKKNTVYVR